MDVKLLYEQIPEFEMIKNSELREKAAKAFLQAMEEGGWTEETYTKLPIEPGKYDKCPLSYVDYTRMMTQLCKTIADTYCDMITSSNPNFDPDNVVAGSLLQGIGKFREYEIQKDGKVGRSEYGKLYRYPWISMWYAKENGLPTEVVYVCVSTSKEYSPGKGKVIKTPENVITIDAELACMDIIKKLYY